MGLFDFWKKEEEDVIISFEELPHWIDDYVKQKKLDQRVEQFRENIENLLSKLGEKLQELEHADLMNPDIPDRAKHVMRGNREHYVNRMKRFLEDVEIPEDYKDIGYFASQLSEDITSLGEDTAKNFQVLTQFFELEVKKIASMVKRLEDRVIEFRKELDNEDLGIIEEVRVKLKQLSDDVKRKKELENEKKEAVEHLRELKEKESKIGEKLEKLKASSAYEKFKELHEKKTEAKERIAEMERELERNFSTLERALKKYSHNTPDEKIVQGYLDSSIHAIFRDEELKIAKIIKELEDKLPELDLKQLKVSSTQEAVDKLTRDYLESFREKVQELRDGVSQVTLKLKDNMTALNISEQENFLNNAKVKVGQQLEHIKELEDEMERLNINITRQRIKEKARELGVKFE